MRLFLCFFALLALTGCAVGQPPSDRSLLTQEVCRFPCWQGLTPGASNLDAVYEQMRKVKFIDKEALILDTDDTTMTLRWWYTTPQEQNRLILKNRVLYSIEIVPNLDFTLADVLAEHGDPAALSVRLESGAEGHGLLAKLYIFYPRTGLIVQFRTDASPAVIDANIRGAAFYVYNPGGTVEPFISIINVLDGQTIHPDQLTDWSAISLPFVAVSDSASMTHPPLLITVTPES